MSVVPFCLCGLQRTCTSLMGHLCLRNFAVEEHGELEWRHWRVEQFPREVGGQPLRLLVCVKDPYAWLSSLRRWVCRSDDKPCRKCACVRHTYVISVNGRAARHRQGLTMAEFLRLPAGESIGPAAHWSAMNAHWLGFCDQYPATTFMVWAEQLYSIEGQREVLARLATAWSLAYQEVEVCTEKQKMCASFESSPEVMDTSFYTECKYLAEFSAADLELINSQLDPALMAIFGYTLQKEPVCTATGLRQ